MRPSLQSRLAGPKSPCTSEGDLRGGGASRSSDANAFCSESASVGNRPQRSRMRGRMSSTKSAGEIVRAGAMGRAWSVANARPIATKIGSVSRAIAELTDSPGSYVSRRNCRGAS